MVPDAQEAGWQTMLKHFSVIGRLPAGGAHLARISTTSLMATFAIPPKDLFPIPLWRPRNGRDAAFVRWQRAHKQLLDAHSTSRHRRSLR